MSDEKQYDAFYHAGWLFLRVAGGLVIGFPVLWLLGVWLEPVAVWVLLNVPVPLQPVMFLAPVFTILGIGLLIVSALRRRPKKGSPQ